VNEDAEENLNVGVALLPNSIDFDPGLRSHYASNYVNNVYVRPRQILPGCGLSILPHNWMGNPSKYLHHGVTSSVAAKS
jgi:hypothetical protein